MEERLKNIVFISICEACILYFTEKKEMLNFNSWCGYYKNYICNDISQIPKGIVKMEFYLYDYLDMVYGFNDIESAKLIFDFFSQEKWIELYEIAKYTLYIQKYRSLV